MKESASVARCKQTWLLDLPGQVHNSQRRACVCQQEESKEEEKETNHAVWSAVNKLAKAFAQKYPGNDIEKIRSHSGRATAITSMMGQGVSLPMSMKFARYKPGSLKVHLNYGQLTCMDVYLKCHSEGTFGASHASSTTQA